MKRGDLIIFNRKYWGLEKPEEYNYSGLLLEDIILFKDDPRMPPDIVTPKGQQSPDETLGIRVFYIMWNELGLPNPSFDYNRADYIEKWYEVP